jgi:hypothetical protein
MSIYDTAADMAHRADELAILLLRQPNHDLHRIAVVLRDLHLTIVQAMASLSDDVHKRIEKLEEA